MISAERARLGARCEYRSISSTTSLMIPSMVSMCGTKVDIMDDREGDMVAPMTRRVCETMLRAPCQR